MSPRRQNENQAFASYIESMAPDPEVKRQKSIAYILRRRKRGRKTGANSGEVIKSAQKRLRGHLVFEPSGSYMSKWRFLAFFGFLGSLALPIVFLSSLADTSWHTRETLARDANDVIGLVLIGLVAVLAVIIFGFAVIYTVQSCWRVIRQLWSSQK